MSWEEAGGGVRWGNHQGSRTLVNIQPGTRLRNVLRRLMRSKDVPRTQASPHSHPPVHVQNQQRHRRRLLPGGTEHGVVAGERGGLWSGRRPGETAWLTLTSGHPGRGLSLRQQHRQWPLRGPGRDRCGERPGSGWI